LVGFLATIAIIEVAGIVILDRQARSSWLSQHAATQHADVKTFESIGRRTATSAAAFAEVDEALGVVIGQPGTITARVVDYQGAVVASGDASEVGSTHVDPHILAALRSNTAYRGDAVESAGSAGSASDVQFVTPLRFTGARYAYAVTYDGASLDSELAATRRALEAVGVGGLLVGIVLFYFLGGRAVIHLHRSALARATRDGMTELPNQRASRMTSHSR
jgi:hypothetical protein